MKQGLTAKEVGYEAEELVNKNRPVNFLDYLSSAGMGMINRKLKLNNLTIYLIYDRSPDLNSLKIYRNKKLLYSKGYDGNYFNKGKWIEEIHNEFSKLHSKIK